MEIAVECVRELQERVDARRSSAGLEARDGRLGRPADARELGLREPELPAALGDLLGDLGEEPAVLRAREPLTEAFDRPLGGVVALFLAKVDSSQSCY